MLVDRRRGAVIEFDLGIQIIHVAQFLGDGMGGKYQPNGIVGEVFVLNISVKEGTGGIAVLILIGENTAKALGCVTVGLSSNPDTAILNAADIKIYTDTGAEVLTGSTRLKAGTAQKIVLNAITTCAMTKSGKVYENMMINLAPSNEKLKRRVIRITKEILGSTEEEAIARLEANEWNIRRAVDKED